jgi:uncharacterized protein with gpF-like domain
MSKWVEQALWLGLGMHVSMEKAGQSQWATTTMHDGRVVAEKCAISAASAD